MNEGDFELNKIGWYEVKNSQPNDFINENLTSDEYGIYYSVVFQGDAETYLWQTKTAPVEGEKYWGHLEKAKSGKSIRFKKDKDAPTGDAAPAGASQTAQKPAYKDNSKNITLGLVWKVLIGIQGVPENDEQFAKFFETVNAHVTELILMGEKLKEEE